MLSFSAQILCQFLLHSVNNFYAFRHFARYAHFVITVTYRLLLRIFIRIGGK